MPSSCWCVRFRAKARRRFIYAEREDWAVHVGCAYPSTAYLPRIVSLIGSQSGQAVLQRVGWQLWRNSMTVPALWVYSPSWPLLRSNVP